MKCDLCDEADEDMDHLFFQCRWARDYWNAIQNWWPSRVGTTSLTRFIQSTKKPKGLKREKMITYAIVTAAIYQIWRTRNEKIFSHHHLTVQSQFKHTKDHITQRILMLNKIIGKYNKCIGRLIG